ncbi:MAG TPA: N-acetylmuramoyl-L-alanine amidase [Nocardioides sp.]|nr:N-acetylmuramoyl-L-alanine amidase [Nocardioides sp.]
MDDDSGASLPHRRQVLRAATASVLGAGAVTAAGAGILRALDSPGSRPGSRLQLQADGGSQVGILERDLRSLHLAESEPGIWQTPALDTSQVTMVGFTWRDAVRPPKILVRFRTRGGWSLWRPAPILRDLPDPRTGEGIGKEGTSPLVVQPYRRPADGIQVRVTGSLPPELSITLIHAARLAADARIATEAARSSAPSTLRAAGIAAPTIYSRAQWGADESWRDPTPRYNNTILQAHVHHSASGNGVAQADVPALIRSYYSYHTKTLGWADLGYNFLIDSFGTIWEGRYGGADRPVRGAHTLGFNAASTGLCVIGDLDQVPPTPATLDALARLAAWKLSMYAGDPLGSVAVTSEGSDKFPAGRVVTLPVIDGHRDTNDTACPGGNLYPQLPNLRIATAALLAAPTLALAQPFVVAGKAILGRTLTVTGGAFTPTSATVSYLWTRAGVPIPEATGPTYVVAAADVGALLGVVVSGFVPGATPISQTVTASKPCRSVPVVTLRAQRRPPGQVVVHVRIAAPGVAAPDGQVVVRIGSRQRKVRVEKGKAIARFTDIRPGRSQVQVTYSRGTSIRSGSAVGWVR